MVATPTLLPPRTRVATHLSSDGRSHAQCRKGARASQFLEHASTGGALTVLLRFAALAPESTLAAMIAYVRSEARVLQIRS